MSPIVRILFLLIPFMFSCVNIQKKNEITTEESKTETGIIKKSFNEEESQSKVLITDSLLDCNFTYSFPSLTINNNIIVDTVLNYNNTKLRILDFGQYSFKGFYFNDTLIKAVNCFVVYNNTSIICAEYYFLNESPYFLRIIVESCCIDAIKSLKVINAYIREKNILESRTKNVWTIDSLTILKMPNAIQYLDTTEKEFVKEIVFNKNEFLDNSHITNSENMYIRFFLETEQLFDVLNQKGIIEGVFIEITDYISYNKPTRQILNIKTEQGIVQFFIDSLDIQLKQVLETAESEEVYLRVYWEGIREKPSDSDSQLIRVYRKFETINKYAP
jgi:hypothetical protein